MSSSNLGHHARDDKSSGWIGSSNSKRQIYELDWRMDPQDSHSDYTLEVEQEDGTVDTYHVHKVILGFGDRDSVYFAGVFASQTAESNSNKSRLSASKSAADAFPLLLDHMYGLEQDETALTIGNAAPIYHMADYLEGETLQSRDFAVLEGECRCGVFWDVFAASGNLSH